MRSKIATIFATVVGLLCGSFACSRAQNPSSRAPSSDLTSSTEGTITNTGLRIERNLGEVSGAVNYPANAWVSSERRKGQLFCVIPSKKGNPFVADLAEKRGVGLEGLDLFETLYLNLIGPTESVYQNGQIHDFINQSALVLNLRDGNSGPRQLTLRKTTIRGVKVDLKAELGGVGVNCRPELSAIRIQGHAPQVDVLLEDIDVSDLGADVFPLKIEETSLNRLVLRRFQVHGATRGLRLKAASNGDALAKELVIEDSTGLSFDLDPNLTRAKLPRIVVSGSADLDLSEVKARKIELVIDKKPPAPASIREP